VSIAVIANILKNMMPNKQMKLNNALLTKLTNKLTK